MVSTKLLGSFIAYALASQALNFRIKAIEHSFFSGQPQLAPGAAMSADIMTSEWEDCPDGDPKDCNQHQYLFGEGDFCASTADSPLKVCGREFNLQGHGPTYGIFRANGDPTDSVPLEGERYAFLHDAEACLGSCYVDYGGDAEALTCGLGSRPRILSCVASMMVTVERGVGFVPDGLGGSFDFVVCDLAFGSVPT
ncbi:hypothetical protein D6C77_08586 [Aureobasidium pullulans]|nr:hypothetical protein D6D08_07520 [Aureobasidium pullulans]TIA52213.1 hypothetical protein D6C77_08586 [Aureobasidium pullulans]